MTQEEKQLMDTNGHTPLYEDYVSFEVAKLLKEKGFDEKCRTYYKVFPESRIAAIYHSSENRGVSEDDPNEILCPTLQMAMKWLREVHNLVILVEFSTFEFNKERPFMWSISYQKVDGDYIAGTYHPTYEEACEAAIKYCLENLI